MSFKTRELLSTSFAFDGMEMPLTSINVWSEVLSSNWHLAHGTWYLGSCIWYLVFGKYVVVIICYRVVATLIVTVTYLAKFWDNLTSLTIFGLISLERDGQQKLLCQVLDIYLCASWGMHPQEKLRCINEVALLLHHFPLAWLTHIDYSTLNKLK